MLINRRCQLKIKTSNKSHKFMSPKIDINLIKIINKILTLIIICRIIILMKIKVKTKIIMRS